MLVITASMAGEMVLGAVDGIAGVGVGGGGWVPGAWGVGFEKEVSV